MYPSKINIFFVFGPYPAQGLLLAPFRCRRLYQVPGIEPGLTKYMAGILPSVLSLCPLMYSFVYLGSLSAILRTYSWLSA